jgi:O-antigen/teichoic acid export membrane protein
MGLGVQAAALAYLSGALAHAGLSAWRSRDLWLARGDASGEPAHGFLADAGRMLREAAPVALPGVFIALYFRIDAVMLYFMEGESAVGFYGGAYGLFEVLLPLSAAYRVMFVPLSYRTGDSADENTRVLGRRTLQALLLMTVGIAAFVSLEATSVLESLIGARYAPAALTLAILIWALPAAFMSDLMHHLLGSQRRQLAGTLVVAGVAAFNIGLNWLMIPPFSFAGAAAATVLSELLCFAALLYLLTRSARRIGFAAAAWRPVLAGAVLAAVLAAVGAEFPSGVVRLILAGIGGAALYMLLLTVSGGAREGDPVEGGMAPSDGDDAGSSEESQGEEAA